MATRTLIDGAVDLTDTASWSASTIPITGDTAIIPRGSQHINVFSLGGVRLERLEVNITGVIETAAGAALAVDVDNSTDAVAIITGTGARMKFSGGSTNAKWENTKVNSPGSFITFTGGEFEDFQLEAGTVTLDATATTDTFRQFGGVSNIGPKASTTTGFYIEGGTATIERSGDYYVDGGTVIIDVKLAGTTNLYLAPGATVHHVNGDIAGGTISGTYIERLEAPATIDSVTTSPRAKIQRSTRGTWTNVTTLGVKQTVPPGYI